MLRGTQEQKGDSQGNTAQSRVRLGVAQTMNKLVSAVPIMSTSNDMVAAISGSELGVQATVVTAISIM